MSGYGGPDDEQERARVTVEEGVALIQAQLPRGPSRYHCIECGEPIAEARRVALIGVVHCIDCATELGDSKFIVKQPWAT